MFLITCLTSGMLMGGAGWSPVYSPRVTVFLRFSVLAVPIKIVSKNTDCECEWDNNDISQRFYIVFYKCICWLINCFLPYTYLFKFETILFYAIWELSARTLDRTWSVNNRLVCLFYLLWTTTVSRKNKLNHWQQCLISNLTLSKKIQNIILFTLLHVIRISTWYQFIFYFY